MTIEKGQAWGSVAPTPFHTVTAPNEEALARAVGAGATHIALESGDLLRTLGATFPKGSVEVGEPSLQVPCDLLQVTIDATTRVCAAGSVRIGSVLRPHVWVAAGGFIGPLNVAPRAHPNDGMLDALEFAPELNMRQLLAVRRRMRLGDHLPHPLLTMRRASEYEWHARQRNAGKASVTIDGRRFGRARRVRIVVQPDAFVLCVPTGQAG